MSAELGRFINRKNFIRSGVILLVVLAGGLGWNIITQPRVNVTPVPAGFVGGDGVSGVPAGSGGRQEGGSSPSSNSGSDGCWTSQGKYIEPLPTPQPYSGAICLGNNQWLIPDAGGGVKNLVVDGANLWSTAPAPIDP